jgi:hypothetical protein
MGPAGGPDHGRHHVVLFTHGAFGSRDLALHKRYFRYKRYFRCKPYFRSSLVTLFVFFAWGRDDKTLMMRKHRFRTPPGTGGNKL